MNSLRLLLTKPVQSFTSMFNIENGVICPRFVLFWLPFPYRDAYIWVLDRPVSGRGSKLFSDDIFHHLSAHLLKNCVWRFAKTIQMHIGSQGAVKMSC